MLHPDVLLDEIEIGKAAILIAIANGNPALSHQWGMFLVEAIKRRELPAHEAESGEALPIARPGQPPRGWMKPHVRREDLHTFCEERGIRSPYDDLPTPPGVAPRKILDRRLAWFKAYCERLDDADLHGWQKRDFLPQLRREEIFKGLKEKNSWNNFWDHAREVLKRVRNARRQK